ncbi:MAG: DUF4296 domain-containing protein [Bacteroidetes bacterium]|nr:DUF4296 domain-containing protein [Bacteroidota bacterium]
MVTRCLAAVMGALLLAGSWGCRSSHKPIPEEKMVPLLADYALAVQAAHLNMPGQIRKPVASVDKDYAALAAVFQHHGVTAGQFWEAWVAYTEDLPALEKLMDKLVSELNQRNARRQGKFVPHLPDAPRGLHLKSPRNSP